MFSVPFLFLAGSLVVLFFYHAFIFARWLFSPVRVEPDRELPVSVVICVRNGREDVEELMPLLMEQDHGEFEVVVVNDRSEDETWEVLQVLRSRYPRLRPVNIQADEKFSYGKKIAVGVGLRAARHPHVLLTDVDCRPEGRDWISTMAAGFRGGRQIVIGNSPYERIPGFTNVMERYDGASKAMQYIAFAHAGLPYMGVGRDLGYTTDLFFQAKGTGRHAHLMSGDDDLFINEVARARNTAAVSDPRSFMVTRATLGLATWIRRKRRHYTTARYYRFGHKVLLTLLPLARAVFWAALVACWVLGEQEHVLIALAVKLFVFLPVTIIGLRRLGAGGLAWAALPLEWLFLLLDPAIYLSTLLIKPRRWK
jgi:glycosyltransferase involved in cell wall biosynthesis